jgi:hypothetical protein
MLVLGAVMFVPVGGEKVARAGAASRSRPMDMSSFSSAPLPSMKRVLFIHHSCGGQWLAPFGPDDGERCIYRSHPNGGGLAPALARAGYELHEASYGSRVGEKTDLFDWLPKFTSQMDEVLSTAHQDERHPRGVRNDIVMFKSCFPNSGFVSEGESPGDPHGPALTVWNARATMNAVRNRLARHPEVLFVYVTAPPLAPAIPRQPVWKLLLKTALGRQRTPEGLRDSGDLARAFNDWMLDRDGWLAGYPHENVVVFDYFGVLTGEGSNLSRYATGDGSDSHPSTEGNTRATEAFVPFLNRAVRRAGLVDGGP